MLRTHWSYSAKDAVSYLSVADYFASSPGELLGNGFKHLDIDGMSARDVFECLAHNLDPKTGEKLRPLARDGERVGMDFTFNSTKSVGIARELAGPGNEGDPRIEEAHREAVTYAMSFIEKDMQTRVRGGRDGDRVTGNLMAYRVTHRDTRISAEDQMPDMSLHDHVFVLNATFDPVEKKWKAAQLGQIKHDAPYYEAIYHNRLAANLRELGYGIRRKDKAFEINGVSDDLVKKFSRRRQYIKAVAEKLGITSPEGMSKLGATTRLGKTKELADDLNPYYVSRLTDTEKKQLSALKGKPSYVSNEAEAVRFAIGHEFERRSVVEERKLYETAIRHGIGSVTPEGVEAESHRQGVLLKNGEATTRDVLEEESRIIAFAREGRGTMRPLAMAAPAAKMAIPLESHAVARGGQQPQFDLATLAPIQQAKSLLASGERNRTNSPAKLPIGSAKVDNLSLEQQAVCRHVWESPDRVILIRGAAGTGKTTVTKAMIAGIDSPYAMLAPTAEASRGVLRREGFEGADTVAAFLGNRDWQAKLKNGVVFVDEAGLLPIRDLSRLTDIAREQNARIVLMGDPKQHKSVARHGNMFRVLQEFAGLPVAELRDIKRQRGQYKEAVAAIDKGDYLKAHDIFTELGYIRETPVWDHNKPLVDDYLDGLKHGKRVLVVAPTHAEGDEITAEIRKRLKEEGKLGDEEKVFATLQARNLTEAERTEGLEDGDTAVFFRSAGRIKAGTRVGITGENRVHLGTVASKFGVYSASEIRLATGDVLRTTAGVKDTSGRRIDNGTFLTVTGFSKDGIEVETANGNHRTLPNDVGHIQHGYVSTSHAAQGKTVDRVLIAMGSESAPAINAEQFYVSASRGRERATIYTDMSPATLRERIQREDGRKSATELLQPKPKGKLRSWLEKTRGLYRQLREKMEGAIHEMQPKGLDHGYSR